MPYLNNYKDRIRMVEKQTITRIIELLKMESLSDFDKIRWVEDAAQFGQLRISNIKQLEKTNE